MAEEGPLEPLVIIEEGDETTSVSQRRGQSGPPPSEPSRGGEPSPKEEEGGNKHEDAAAAATVRSEPARAREEENRAEEGENTDEEQKGRVTQQKGENVKENPEDDGEDVDNQLPVDPESSEQQAGGTKSPEEDPQQVCGAFFCSVPDTCDIFYGGRFIWVVLFVLPCLFPVSLANPGLPRGAVRAAVHPAGGQAAQRPALLLQDGERGQEEEVPLRAQHHQTGQPR